MVVFVAESDDVLPNTLAIAVSAVKGLLALGATTWVTPVVVVARNMEQGQRDAGDMGVSVVHARHLGQHLAVLPVCEPAPAPMPHVVYGATGPRRRRMAEVHGQHLAAEFDFAAPGTLRMWPKWYLRSMPSGAVARRSWQPRVAVTLRGCGCSARSPEAMPDPLATSTFSLTSAPRRRSSTRSG